MYSSACAGECRRNKENGWKWARRYSDISFALSVLSFVSTILIVVFVYAIGDFPRSTYFCREDVINDRSEIRKECPSGEEE